jgi:hypothetical protein
MNDDDGSSKHTLLQPGVLQSIAITGGCNHQGADGVAHASPDRSGGSEVSTTRSKHREWSLHIHEFGWTCYDLAAISF